MNINEKYPGININEEEFKEKVKSFKKLINDLQKAIDDYHKIEPTRFGACLMSRSDIDEWQEMNQFDKSVFFIKLNKFWNFSIAMTDSLAFIPLEDIEFSCE